jgi:hypothetical protein
MANHHLTANVLRLMPDPLTFSTDIAAVLRDVPPRTTVAGIPARVVGKCTVAEPAVEMDTTFQFPESGAGIS